MDWNAIKKQSRYYSLNIYAVPGCFHKNWTKPDIYVGGLTRTVPYADIYGLDGIRRDQLYAYLPLIPARVMYVKLFHRDSCPTVALSCLIIAGLWIAWRHRDTVAVWLSGNVVGLINEVTLRRAGLVLRWVTVLGYTVLVLWRDVGMCVPFPVEQINANNVIYNICLLYTSDAADE